MRPNGELVSVVLVNFRGDAGRMGNEHDQRCEAEAERIVI